MDRGTKTNMAEFALNQMYKERHQSLIQNAEIAMLIQSAVNSKALSWIMEFADAIIGSSDEEKRERFNIKRDYTRHGVKHDAEILVSYIRNYERTYARRMAVGISEEKAFDDLCKIANAMDESDEILGNVMADLNQYLDKRIWAKTLSTPEDPQIVKHFCLSFLMVDFCAQLWDYWLHQGGLPFLKVQYNHMGLAAMDSQLRKIADKIDWRDARTNGKLKFNIAGILKSKDLEKILKDMQAILFSAAFVDRLIIARDGKDPHIRDHTKSILECGICSNEVKVS